MHRLRVARRVNEGNKDADLHAASQYFERCCFIYNFQTLLVDLLRNSPDEGIPVLVGRCPL